MTRRFRAALMTLLVTTALVLGAPVVLNDGIIDALCSMLHPDDPLYVYLGCTNKNDPSGG